MDKLFANRERGWIGWGWATLGGGLLFAIRTAPGLQHGNDFPFQSTYRTPKQKIKETPHEQLQHIDYFVRHLALNAKNNTFFGGKSDYSHFVTNQFPEPMTMGRHVVLWGAHSTEHAFDKFPWAGELESPGLLPPFLIECKVFDPRSLTLKVEDVLMEAAPTAVGFSKTFFQDTQSILLEAVSSKISSGV